MSDLRSMIPMNAQQYAEEWSISSDEHKVKNDYDWIAASLDKPSLILEIGCGNGNGTESLLNINSKVISIEINEHLAAKAYKRLSDLGFKVELIDSKQISDISLTSETQLFIIISSVFDDSVEYVASSHNFDYVLFSFFGAAPIHAAKELGKEIVDLDMDYARDYREKATKRAYDLSRTRNTSDTKLVIVDRGAQPKGYSKFDYKHAVANDINERLDVSVNHSDVKLRVNEAKQRTTSSSAMKYITNSNFTGNVGTPLIMLTII